MNADRANAMVLHAMQKLGSRFQICSYDTNPRNWIFGISEKAKPGEFFDDVQETMLDGRVRKLRVKNHGGITMQQMAIIESTSAQIGEGGDRIIDLIVNKHDTTMLVPQKSAAGLSVDQVRDLIASAIAEDRKQRDDQRLKVEQVIERVEQERKAEVAAIPQGLQQKPKTSRIAQTEAKNADVQMWRERAKLLDYKQPRLNAAGHVDKRWIRFFLPMWESHLKAQPQEVTA